MTKIPWTDQEVEIIHKLAGLGYSCKEIQQVLKSRTLDSIYQKARAENIPIGANSPEVDMALYEQLVSLRQPI